MSANDMAAWAAIVISLINLLFVWIITGRYPK